MTVEQFRGKWDEFQKEANAIYSELKPIFSRLRKLARKGIAIERKADCDTNLYVKDERTGYRENGWNCSLQFRLRDLDYLDDAIENIDTVLFNIKHTKFRKNRRECK